MPISQDKNIQQRITFKKKKKVSQWFFNRGVKIFVLSLYIHLLPEEQVEEPFFPKGTQSDGQCEELKITLY